MSSALWVLLPLPFVLAVIDRGVIAREERYLERKFGEEYLAFKAPCGAGSEASLDQTGPRMPPPAGSPAPPSRPRMRAT